MQDISLYLQATPYIESKHPLIREKAGEITRGLSSEVEKAVKLFNYVRDKCHYNMYATTGDIEAYRASVILAKGQGWCVQKAVLLAALCRAAGIPCGLLLVTIRNHKSPPEAVKMMQTNVFFPHMYNSIFLNGKWVKAAPTFDRKICERTGVPVVNFDGLNDAILPGEDLQGNPYIEYLEDYGMYPDLPWDFILENSYRIYGDLTEHWLGPK
ncbi:MAG: transglutaminase family protein [Syntrophomonadaceae bacterium]|nr:transglutaminase family protein [Syntrophomonadaceae bacterium]